MSIASTGLSREERAERSGWRLIARAHGPACVSILEAARLTSLCRSTIYELLKAGRAAVDQGRRSAPGRLRLDQGADADGGRWMKNPASPSAGRGAGPRIIG